MENERNGEGCRCEFGTRIVHMMLFGAAAIDVVITNAFFSYCVGIFDAIVVVVVVVVYCQHHRRYCHRHHCDSIFYCMI